MTAITVEDRDQCTQVTQSWTITYLVVSHQEPRLSTPVHQLEGTLRLCLWLLDAHESVFACVHICVGGMFRKC